MRHPGSNAPSSGGAFSRRSAVGLAVAGGLSLLAAAVLGVFGDVLSDPLTAGPDAWSRSALGHRAFLELLRTEGHPVLLSRHATAARAREGALVALLEPALLEGDDTRGAALEAIARSAGRLLVVLPKRTGAPDPEKPRWIAAPATGADGLLSTRRAERLLELLALDGDVIRPDQVGPWRGALPAPTLDHPQLVRGARLRPLLETDQGVLVGEAELRLPDDEGDDDAATEAGNGADGDASDEGETGGRVLVLADPDVIAHHGLGKGENAALGLALVERLAAPGEQVVVDETLHGHEQQPSLARELLSFPLVLATLQALGAALLLAGAALARFGRPRPAPEGLSPGKAFLVANTAELLRAGGHVGDAATAYLRAARDEVLARLHPPPGEAPQAWLRRMEAARGKAGALAALEARAAQLRRRRHGAAAEAVRLARDIHRWREELTDGAD